MQMRVRRSFSSHLKCLVFVWGKTKPAVHGPSSITRGCSSSARLLPPNACIFIKSCAQRQSPAKCRIAATKRSPPSYISQSFPLAWEPSSCWNSTVLCVTSTPRQFLARGDEKMNSYVLFIECIINANTVCAITLFFFWQDAVVDSARDARNEANIWLAGSHEQFYPRTFSSTSINDESSSLLQQ